MSFQKLKEFLISVTILALVEKDVAFVVYCNSSGVSLGGILMQKGRVITYVLQHLKVHENNYPTYDVELVATIFVLKLWRPYLYRCIVRFLPTIVASKYIYSKPNLNTR